MNFVTDVQIIPGPGAGEFVVHLIKRELRVDDAGLVLGWGPESSETRSITPTYVWQQTNAS